MNSSLGQVSLALLFSLNLFLASQTQPTLGPEFQANSSTNSFLTLQQAVWSQHSEKHMLGVQPELLRSLRAVSPQVAGTLGTS